jgi:hypothetical protein
MGLGYADSRSIHLARAVQMQPGSRRVRKRSRLVSLLAAALLLLSAFGATLFPPGGRSFLWVDAPTPGQVVAPGGVDVLVRFAPSERVAPETFRCLLNGIDVTEALTTGENGAYGRVYRLVDGENLLRLEIFGRVWWSRDSLIERSREIRFRLRRRIDLHRG